jgi:hypothetical protein
MTYQTQFICPDYSGYPPEVYIHLFFLVPISELRTNRPKLYYVVELWISRGQAPSEAITGTMG